MPLHPDLLTDEDFRQEPRQEEPKRYFNQFICLVEGGKFSDDAKHLARQQLIHQFGYDPKDIPS